jgi:hypothetical protein
VYNLLGLSGDPFSKGFDLRLYWENHERKRLLEEGAKALLSSQNLWIKAEKGSGCGWFIRKLLGETGAGKVPILFTEGEMPGDTLPFLASLGKSASIENPTGDLPSVAEKLYTKLLRRFWQGGTLLVVPGTSPLSGEGVLREVSHLASTRIKGKALCNFVLRGEADSPPEGFQRLTLPPFSPEDLQSCLRHRAEAFGNRDVFPVPALKALCQEAKGVGHAMELASASLERLLFDRREPLREEKPGEPQKPVLPGEQVSEISRLLAAISS